MLHLQLLRHRGASWTLSFLRVHPAGNWVLAGSLSLAAHAGLLYFVQQQGAMSQAATKQASVQPRFVQVSLQPSAPSTATALPAQLGHGAPLTGSAQLDHGAPRSESEQRGHGAPPSGSAQLGYGMPPSGSAQIEQNAPATSRERLPRKVLPAGPAGDSPPRSPASVAAAAALLSAMPDPTDLSPHLPDPEQADASSRACSAPPGGSPRSTDSLQAGAQAPAAGLKAAKGPSEELGPLGPSGRGRGAYGNVDRKPQKLSACAATYPESARQQKLTGKVVLDVEVGSDGRVGDIVVVSGLGLGLSDAAVSAVKTCHFSPAQWQGSAVASRIKYVYTFVLQD